MEQEFKYLFEEASPAQCLGLSPQEVLEKEKIAFNKGYNKGKQEAEKAQEADHDNEENSQQYLELLNNINKKLTSSNKNYYQTLEKQLYDLAISVGEKLSSINIEKKYYDITKKFIQNIIKEISDGKTISIHTNSQLTEQLKQDFTGYSIIADDKIKIGDCIIKWGKGRATHLLKDRKNEIEKILLQEEKA